MLKTISLTENRQFRALYARGKSHAAKTLVVYAAKNRLGRCRLGITVSKKLGCAVERNRMRRRIKECYRLNESRVRDGFDLVVVARRSTLGAPFAQLQSDFLFCLGQLKVRCD